MKKTAKKTTKKTARPFVIVRTYSAGVHTGTLVSQKGKLVTLANSRRIWRWFGANTLSDIATNGLDTVRSRVSAPVARIDLTEAIEVIYCTKKSVEAIGATAWGTQ